MRFLLDIVGVLLLEAVLFWCAQRFVDISSTTSLANLSAERAAYEAVGSELVHNLIKGVGAGALLWLLLYGANLYRACTAFRSGGQTSRLSSGVILFHLMAFAGLILVRAKLKGYGSASIEFDQRWVVGAYAALSVGFVASLLMLLAPARFWRNYLYEHRWRFAALGSLCAVVAISTTLGIGPGSIEAHYANVLFGPTASMVAQILQWWGYQVHVGVDSPLITVDQFSVSVASSCLGYEGASIAVVVSAIYLYVNRSELRFPRALLVVPATIVALTALNVIRIAVLLAIGASWSPDVAVYGFHSVAGWINLLVVLLLAILLLNQSSFFSKSPARFAFDLAGGKVQLLPQFVLIAVAMASLLVSPGFDWLYAVRVIVVGGVLWIFWPRLAVERIDGVRAAVCVGIAVFILWIALVPQESDKSATFARNLFSAPPWLALTWLAFRTVGSVVVVPLAEELAFRGYLFTLIERLPKPPRFASNPRARQLLALLLTSAAFGLLHSAWLAATLAGLGYGLLRIARNRVVDAVIAHATTNLLLAIYVMYSRAWSLW